MRINKLIAAAVVVSILIVPGIAGCTSLAENEAAKVNGRIITRDQVGEYAGLLAAQEKQIDITDEMLHSLELQALDELVVDQLVMQDAEKRGITVDDAEIESRLAQIKAEAFGNDDKTLEEGLKKQGITLEEAKYRVGKTILASKLHDEVVAEAGDVSDQEVEDYYNANRDSFSHPESRHLRHILTATEADARAAKARLEAGEDPALVAAQVSIDTSTKDKGGDLDWMNEGVAAPAFNKAAFSLAAGVWSDPVQTPSGWNVIRVEEIKPGGIPSFDEVKADVRESLVTDRIDEAWNSWLAETRHNADIEYAPEYRELESGTPMEGGGTLPEGHPQT